jgi:hypothetical protein
MVPNGETKLPLSLH